MVRFIKTTSAEAPAEFVAKQISSALANDKNVLWLVPGGSAAEVAVLASQLIHGVDSNLYISLTDERPGPALHTESNWLHLTSKGFNYLTRQYYPILQNHPTDQTVSAYNVWLSRTLQATDYKIGLFGIGTDGHTAGILTGATTAPIGQMAAFYKSGINSRISVTPLLISHLDLVVAYAVGANKHQIIDQFETGDSDLPMMTLNKCRNLIIYNGIKGEK